MSSSRSCTRSTTQSRSRRGRAWGGRAAGSDERVIEIPWVLSRYRGEARVLDVGSARAGLHIEEHELYGHDGEGWRSTDALDAGYGTTGAATSGVLCADLHPGGPLRGLSGF